MENPTQTLCRICFDAGHFHLNGYEINIQGKNISIDKMIKRFSDIEFTDVNAPELICENCTHDLVQSYLFTEKILEADAKILSLTQEREEEKFIYEQELVQSSVRNEEEFVCESVEDDNIDIQEVVSENINEVHNEDDENMEVLSSAEQQVVIEEEEQESDFIEESPESNTIDEMYIESEFSADENEQTTSFEEQETLSTIDHQPVENLSNNTPLNYNNLYESEVEEEESIEPRKKYQRRNKTDNEIDKNGSFVITQFASSTSAPGMHHRNTNNAAGEDTDEVTLSDVRIMNYETVEVKAGNIDVLSQSQVQSELPIDDSRVYLCQYCPRAFSSSAFLVAHVRKTHGCKFCASLFAKAKDLYSHIRESHSKFECVVCGKQFASNSNMRNHLKIVHKVKVPANVSLISYKKHGDIEETI